MFYTVHAIVEVPEKSSKQQKGQLMNNPKIKAKSSKQHGWTTIFNISANQQIVNPQGFKTVLAG